MTWCFTRSKGLYFDSFKLNNQHASWFTQFARWGNFLSDIWLQPVTSIFPTSTELQCLIIETLKKWGFSFSFFFKVVFDKENWILLKPTHQTWIHYLFTALVSHLQILTPVSLDHSEPQSSRQHLCYHHVIYVHNSAVWRRKQTNAPFGSISCIQANNHV